MTEILGLIAALLTWTALAEGPDAQHLPSETRRKSVQFFAPDEVQSQLGQRGFEILDLRDGGWAPDWVAPPAYRKGHLPGALPFNGSFASAGENSPDSAALRSALAQLGPRAGDVVDLESQFLLYGEDAADPRPTRLAESFQMAGLKVAVLAGGYAAWAQASKRPQVEILQARELATHIGIDGSSGQKHDAVERVVVFDLREDWDFARGHLPGAVSLPSHRFARELASIVASAEQPRPILAFYCYGRDCIRSRDCAVIAAQRGFIRLLWLRGGIEEWQAEGLPIVKEKAPESSGAS